MSLALTVRTTCRFQSATFRHLRVPACCLLPFDVFINRAMVVSHTTYVRTVVCDFEHTFGAVLRSLRRNGSKSRR